MNAQHVQQVWTQVRHTIARYSMALGLSLWLLVIVLALQPFRDERATTAPTVRHRPTIAAASPGWPGATLMGSAYSGQTDHTARRARAAASPGWPGATLMGSAYNGQTDHATRRAPAAASPGWPGATLMGSAYNGQTDHANRHAPAATSPGWPGATLMGSAYNGQ